MKRDAVIAILTEHLDHLRGQYGVRHLSLFGSVARDQAGPGSDVDILVEFDRPTGLFGLFRLQDQLAEILGCPVDLGTAEGLKPRVRERVRQELIRVAYARCQKSCDRGGGRRVGNSLPTRVPTGPPSLDARGPVGAPPRSRGQPRLRLGCATLRLGPRLLHYLW
ncbi:MAG: nucleotidyltransferase family protein [Planctomycetes bacterium]|nr:nucleotidyltransferase family protein [Planctomycetota bacterium]